MAFFSESDINEAKRRVREMQSRADYYVSDEENKKNTTDRKSSNAEKKRKNTQIPPENQDESGDLAGSFLSDILGDGDKSQLIILVLILVLSREGADNMLILALLYLLL